VCVEERLCVALTRANTHMFEMIEVCNVGVCEREKERVCLCVCERERGCVCVCQSAALCGANAREYADV